MNSNFTHALINENTDKDTINFAFEIYKSNPEYFKLSSDKKVEIADLMNDIKAIPPNVNPNNKETSLYSFKESALAIMDILKFYPDEDTCYVGLLIINSSFQN